MLRNTQKELLPVDQTFECYDRCPREDQFISNARDEIPIEDVEALYSFLQGEVPPELTLDYPPKLSQKEAFSVIYYLQEIMGLLPDRYEQCCECGNLYDSHEEGRATESGTYCDYHWPYDDEDGEERE